MKNRTTLLAILFSLPLPVAASTLYKCTDASGVVLYTNQKTRQKSCSVISVLVPPAPKSNSGPASPRPPRASATPTPADFPRVSNSEQKARDTDRHAILVRELAAEQSALDAAKHALANAGANPASTLRDTVALHARNIEALNKELARLR